MSKIVRYTLKFAARFLKLCLTILEYYIWNGQPLSLYWKPANLAKPLLFTEKRQKNRIYLIEEKITWKKMKNSYFKHILLTLHILYVPLSLKKLQRGKARKINHKQKSLLVWQQFWRFFKRRHFLFTLLKHK